MGEWKGIEASSCGLFQSVFVVETLTRGVRHDGDEARHSLESLDEDLTPIPRVEREKRVTMRERG